jgi:hypothetical protein
MSTCIYIFQDNDGQVRQLGENAFKAWLATGDNLEFLHGGKTTQHDSAEKGNADNKDGSDAVAFSRAAPFYSQLTRAFMDAKAGKQSGNLWGMTIAEVTAAIMPIRKLWENAPPIVIVDNINHKDVPEAIRAEDEAQRANGATGSVAGVFHGGKVYLVADQITSAQDAVTTLFHESLGHYGLRGVFGDELGVVLNQVMLSHNKAFMDKAKNYGYATSIEKAREKVQAYLDRKGLAKPSNFEELAKAKLKKDRDGAAEEVLAELAQTKPELNLVQKAIAAIKTFLRKIGLLDQANMTDNEIINNFILPARGFVERGERMKNDGGVSFQRVFHGSPHRFDKFDSAHMGTGAGAQAYGFGHYVSDDINTARTYKVMRTTVPDDTFKIKYNISSAQARGDQKRVNELLAQLESMKAAEPGSLYEVEIPEDDTMLLWDKPPRKRDISKVLKGLLRDGIDYSLRNGNIIYKKDGSSYSIDTFNGSSVYQGLSALLDSDKAASEYLKSIGINGIKYLDGTSRADGEGSYNYVIFDDADISIEKTHFSRAEANQFAMPPSAVKAVVDNIKSKWPNAPRVIVVDSIQDDRVPKAVRRDNARLMALGAHGRPEGFMHNGDVYLVADALPNGKRVGEVFLHEVVGHYGLRGAFGEVLTSVLDRVANARGTEVEAKAKKYGLATDMQSAMKAERVSAEKSGEDISGLSAMQLRERAKTRLRQDTLTAAEEVLAEMTETNPRAGFVRMAIASIRTFLREIGLLNSAAMTDDEIIQQFIVPARRYVERVTSVKDGRSRDAKAWKQSAAEIAHDGELFAYDRTISTNMADSLRVIAPGADILAVQKAGGDARYVLSLPNGNEATITTRTRRLGRDDGRYGLDGGNDIAGQNSTAIAKDAMEVFLDVSKVGNGNGGSMIYAVAADHAANNGGILIGDPSGLSGDGLARRAENMLSSALKYGTTKHLAPHPRQIEGDFAGIGVIPLQWTHGDDAGNTLSLMNVVVSRIEVMSPTIMSEYGYDTERRTFIDTKTGKSVSSKRLFEDVDKRWGSGDWHGDTPVGSRTLARGLLFKSLVQRASEEGGASGGRFADRLLDQLASLAADAESQTWKIFYSRRPDGRDGLAETGEIGNNGDFSLDTDNINFSRSAQQTVQQSQAAQQQSILSSTKDWLAGKGDDVMPAALGVLTLKHLADVSSKVLPQINDYVKLTDKMQADRNGMMNESGEIITDWQKWAGENRKMQETLADLMSRSTISGQHPGKDYAPINIQKANRELAKAQDELLRATTPEAKRVLNEQIKETKELIDYETSGKRKAEYDDMRKVWDTQLNDKAREIYENVRKHYEKRAHDTYQALVDRINNSAMSGKTAMLEKMRKEYEARRVHGVYFPLARQGDYWLNATDPNGERVFMMFDTSKELKQAQRAVASGGFTEITTGRKVDNESNAGMNAGFVLDVMNTIGNNVSDDTVSAAMRDEVYQLFLKTMPDMSMRKALIHRKKVAGYSNDVIRGFAIRSQHMAHQISRMRVSQQLQQFMTDMRKDAKDDPSVQKSALLNEMQKRHQWVMNPQDSAWANKLTGLGFLWYLGASPAAAAVNLTQLGVTTLPVLAAKHGFIKSQVELTKAMSAAFGKGMNAAEQAMLKALEGAGVIETTMAHDVAGIGSTGTEGYNPIWNKTIGGVAWMFHQAEVFNRKTTALAAYRLALSKPGTTAEQAIEYAQDVIWESHFDYGNINRSRYMQPNIAKVLLLFKQYALNVSYYLLRNAYNAVAGETAQIKKEAMIKLGGTMAVTFTLAGVSGLPVFGMIAGLVGAVMALGGGDDDEPFKLETAMYAWIKKEYGADIANLVLNGPTNAITGVDFAGRTSMGELWLRSPDRELEGKALAHHYLEQLAGPVVGMPISFMAGLQMMQDGHMERGFEKMVPKAARDLLQAYRFHDEGALNLRDAPLVEKDDMTLYDVLLRGSGFTPAKLAEVYDSNSRVTNVQTFLHDRRQTLINRAWLAKSSGDDGAWAKNMEAVREWNTKYPKDRMTVATLHKSFKSRDKAKGSMESGVIVKDKYRDAIEGVR